MGPRRQAASEVVSFRASKDLLELIDKAAEPFGLSRGEWVKGTIINHFEELARSDGDEWEVKEFKALLEGVNENIGRSLYILLTLVGDVSKEEARAAVERLLLS